MASGPADRVYRNYIARHWKELIDRYDAALLWSDIGYPPSYNLAELFAYFYNRRSDGVINDRWYQTPIGLRNPIGKFVLKQAAAWLASGGLVAAQHGRQDELRDAYGPLVQTRLKDYGETRIAFYGWPE